MEQTTHNPDFVDFLNYIMPHIDLAINEGKTNGHNFNSYFPAGLKDKIPNCFRDIVWLSISKIKYAKSTLYKVNSRAELKFLNLDSYDWKYSQNGVYQAFKNGVADLLYALKCVEKYLNKNA